MLISYFGFTKDLPFSRGFEFKAVFPSANSIRLNSPVRIAGVNVGTVKKIEGQAGTNNAVITMEMKDTGLPIHKDAELKIRPRIFLEGNFFVDLEPGTPSAPTISDGDTIPVAQTATPVQFDQLLTALQQDTRQSLQTTLQEFGTSLTAKPTAAEDADQPIYTKGLTAAQALNSAIAHGVPALRDSAIVQTALQGERARRPHRPRARLRATSAASSPRASGSSASSSRTSTPRWRRSPPSRPSLSATVARARPDRQAGLHLARLAGRGAPARARVLARARPRHRADASRRSTRSRRGSRRPASSSRRSSSAACSTTSSRRRRASPRSPSDDVPLLKQGGLLARCFSDVILPTGDVKLDDGKFSSGKPNYQEFWYAVTGQAGEGQNIDGNGRYIRAQAGGGATPVKLTGGTLTGKQDLYGNSVGTPQGTKPAWPGATLPPQKLDAAVLQAGAPGLREHAGRTIGRGQVMPA